MVQTIFIQVDLRKEATSSQVMGTSKGITTSQAKRISRSHLEEIDLIHITGDKDSTLISKKKIYPILMSSC